MVEFLLLCALSDFYSTSTNGVPKVLTVPPLPGTYGWIGGSAVVLKEIIVLYKKVMFEVFDSSEDELSSK